MRWPKDSMLHERIGLMAEPQGRATLKGGMEEGALVKDVGKEGTEK